MKFVNGEMDNEDYIQSITEARVSIAEQARSWKDKRLPPSPPPPWPFTRNSPPPSRSCRETPSSESKTKEELQDIIQQLSERVNDLEQKLTEIEKPRVWDLRIQK